MLTELTAILTSQLAWVGKFPKRWDRCKTASLSVCGDQPGE
jgi:hypothetical protein